AWPKFASRDGSIPAPPPQAFTKRALRVPAVERLGSENRRRFGELRTQYVSMLPVLRRGRCCGTESRVAVPIATTERSVRTGTTSGFGASPVERARVRRSPREGHGSRGTTRCPWTQLPATHSQLAGLRARDTPEAGQPDLQRVGRYTEPVTRTPNPHVGAT